MCRIPDPDARKPDDWDEEAPEYIVDEDATMPTGWLEDEEELVPDPDADKPEDWCKRNLFFSSHTHILLFLLCTIFVTYACLRNLCIAVLIADDAVLR